VQEHESEITALDRADSRAEQAYRVLREQIATGRLAPGEQVTERGLAVQLGVSPTPVREALRRLEQQRLVERVSARRLRITAQSEESLRELMHTEVVLRAAAARFATAKIGADVLAEMTELVDRLEADPEHGDPEQQLTLARRFDELLLAAADNDVVTGLIDSVSVFGWTSRVKAVQSMHDSPDIGRGRIRDHRDILAALRARDADRVEQLVRRHLTGSIDYLLAQGR
jgi:DNA-binding GntR family transcriptional regulator